MPITKYYMINQLDQKTLDYINLNKISKIRFNHLFNKDISSWNISKVNDMGQMFFEAQSFNQDLNAWGIRFMNGVRQTSMFASSGQTEANISEWPEKNMDELFVFRF